jgi:N-acetylneuraminic acid mutarotase
MRKNFALLLALVFLTSLNIFVANLASSAEIIANSWTTKAPIPEAISGARAAVVNGKIYVIGDEANFEYNPDTETWTGKKPMPTPREYFGIAVYQNKIYTLGGRKWINDTNVRYSVNEVYDPATDTWETKTSMSTNRSEIDANVVSGKIYVISGHNDVHWAADVDGVELNEAYDVATDSWITKTSIPYPVIGYASTVLDDKIYIMGGGCRSNTNWTRTQIYYTKNDSWSLGASLLTVVPGAAAGSTTGMMAPKRIYVIGGNQDSFPALNVTQVYDPDTNTWLFGAPMPIARDWLTIVALNDTLFAVGGSPTFMTHSVVLIEQYTPFGYGTPDPSYVPPIESTPPEPSELFPVVPVAVASVTVVVSASVGLLVYFKKRKR